MEATRRARQLRIQLTDAERKLWHALRDRRFAGYKFRRQQPLGIYFVDFVCLEKRLILEVDGGHHAEQVEYDRARDLWLHEQGFNVLRFTDREALMETASVQEAILAALRADPSPSPARGEGTVRRRGGERHHAQ